MYVPPQGQYSPPQNFLPKKPKKSRKGLIIGLIVGGGVLIAAAVVLVILLMGGTPVVGVWYSDSLEEALEFKETGKVYIYSVTDKYRGKYEYDKKSGEGVVEIDDEEYSFTVDKEEIIFEDKSAYKRADEDFDIKQFIEELVVSLPPEPAETTTPEPTEAEIPEPTSEKVADKALTLTFSFGKCTGIYTGELMGGLPDGYGKFVSADSDGDGWSYEGQWAAGHLFGQGTTVWEDGFSNGGWYENDLLNGEGWESWYGVLQYEGGYLDSEYNGQGTYYNYYSEIIYSGAFNSGIIQESVQDRLARIDSFKDQSTPSTVAELYSACEYEVSICAQVTGEIFQIFYYPESTPPYCEIRIYETACGNRIPLSMFSIH